MNLKDTKQEIKSMIKQEVSNIDYTQQMLQINDMLINLKDSYLELSNKINNTQIENEEIDKEENRNIIDFKHIKSKRVKKSLV